MGQNSTQVTGKQSEQLFGMMFQKQLKTLQREKDVTVAQVARATSLSAKTIHGWLAGNPPGDVRKLKRIADYFGVSLDFLCFGEIAQTRSMLEDHESEINAGVFEVVLRKVKK